MEMELKARDASRTEAEREGRHEDEQNTPHCLDSGNEMRALTSKEMLGHGLVTDSSSQEVKRLSDQARRGAEECERNDARHITDGWLHYLEELLEDVGHDVVVSFNVQALLETGREEGEKRSRRQVSSYPV